ncbi:hypothetical protein ACJX0J_022272, partial [Zea mays]
YLHVLYMLFNNIYIINYYFFTFFIFICCMRNGYMFHDCFFTHSLHFFINVSGFVFLLYECYIVASMDNDQMIHLFATQLKTGATV